MSDEGQVLLAVASVVVAVVFMLQVAVAVKESR